MTQSQYEQALDAALAKAQQIIGEGESDGWQTWSDKVRFLPSSLK